MTSTEVTPEVSPICTPVPDDGNSCTICNNTYEQPRLLSCLHVFCTPCLQKLAVEAAASDVTNGLVTLTCTVCKQETKLPSRGVTELSLDHVLCNQLDLSAIEEKQIVCTSCKAKEKAVARCSDCANFLCPNCVTAHQYMRCFEKHKVVHFEDLQNGDRDCLHKPLFCSVHPSELLTFYCHTCYMPICNDCIIHSHRQPDHKYDNIAEIESKQRDELRNLVSESKGKVALCGEASSSLENALSELEIQRDNARGLIEETFQTYRTMLEKRQETLLKELSDIHTKQELAVMELFHTVEQTEERIEDACKFTERILEHGNGVEMLSLKKNITSQLLSLINNPPKLDVDTKIEFVTNASKFEDALVETFGSFYKEPPKEQQLSSIHSSFENETFGMLSPVENEQPLNHQIAVSEYRPMLQNLPPLPLTSLGNIGSNFGGVSAQTINSIASSIQSIATERSSSRNSHSPAMSDSGISVDAASSGSGSNTPMANLAALSKLGSINVNNQGAITLNGQVIPGLHIGNVTGLPSGLSSRIQTPTPDASPELHMSTWRNPDVAPDFTKGRVLKSQSFDLREESCQATPQSLYEQKISNLSPYATPHVYATASLANLLSNTSLASTTSLSRSSSQIDSLPGLMTQSSSQVNGMGSVPDLDSPTMSNMTLPGMPINGRVGGCVGAPPTQFPHNTHPPFSL